MDHISYNLLNLLTCVGPDVGTTSIRKHSNLKSLRKLLTFSPSNEGCLDILLDIPIIRGKSAQAEYHNIFRSLLADIISNGAALFPILCFEAGVIESECCGELSELKIPGLTFGQSGARQNHVSMYICIFFKEEKDFFPIDVGTV